MLLWFCLFAFSFVKRTEHQQTPYTLLFLCRQTSNRKWNPMNKRKKDNTLKCIFFFRKEKTICKFSSSFCYWPPKGSFITTKIHASKKIRVKNSRKLSYKMCLNTSDNQEKEKLINFWDLWKAKRGILRLFHHLKYNF